MDPTSGANHDLIDATTASLLIRLQIEDLDHLANSAKGKSREGELTDAELARNMYREDLERVAAIAADQRMTESIAQAVQLDGPEIVQSLLVEDVNASDRNLVQQLARGTTRSAPARSASSAEAGNLDDETLDKLAALYVAVPSENDVLVYESDDRDEPAESSSRAAHTVRSSGPFFRQCVTCREHHKFFDVVRAPCGHEYCRGCLEELFRLSVTDESLCPPRCCRKPFDLRNVRMFVPSELLKEVEIKRREFETPNRTYCHAASCSTFIPAQHITNDVATCPRCEDRTCITCKSPAHGGDCPRDAGLQQALELATAEGWQRCTRCWTVVELRDGCYHITCRCGANFCYLCGEQWKTCNCQQWDIVRLRRRAAHIVDRDFAAAPPPDPIQPNQQALGQEGAADAGEGIDLRQDAAAPPIENVPDRAQEVRAARQARDTMVERLMQDLNENHDCQHARWRFVRGPHQCEECMDHLPEYIFQCRQCHIHACNRCRRNRL